MNKKMAWLAASFICIGLMALVFSVRKAQAQKSGGYACGNSEGVGPDNIAGALNGLNCDSGKPFTVSLMHGDFKAVACCYSR